MENLLILFFVVAILLILVTIVVAIILAYSYFSLRAQMPRRIQEQYQAWRERDIDAIRKEQRDIATQDALAQLQQWRGQEIESVRKEQLEIARGEASVQLEQWKAEYTQSIRQEAIQKSQAVTIGKVTEHFVPYLPDFGYNPKDARFLGSPIDFVVFDGLNDGEVRCIVFVEVKTGVSTLSTRERRIKEAVQSGKVQWIEIRPQLDLNQSAAVISSTG